MIVRMLENRRVGGVIYTSGTSYDVSDDLGALLVGGGWAVRTDQVVRSGDAFWGGDGFNNAAMRGPDARLDSADQAVAAANRRGTPLAYPVIGMQPRSPWTASLVPLGTSAINEGITNGGTVTPSVSTAVLFRGRPSTQFVVTGSPNGTALDIGVSTAAFSLDAEAQLLATRGIVVAVKADAIGTGGIASVRVLVGDGTYANVWEVAASESVVDADGWRIFMAHPSEAGALTVTGTPVATGARRCKIRISANGSLVQQGTYHVAVAAAAPAQKGRLVLTCDDGYDEWHDYLLPALVERSLPASLSVDSIYADSVGFMTTPQFRQWASHPAELFEFTNHAGNNEAFVNIGLGPYLARVDACDAYLARIGAAESSRKLHVFVQGSTGAPLVAALQARGFVSGRVVGGSTGQSRRPLLAALDSSTAQLFDIPVAANLQSGVSVATVVGYIQAAINAGTTVFLMGHKFEPTAGVITYVNGYDAAHGMSNLLDYIALERDAGRLDVLKWSDWVAACRRGRTL
jgi:hypothetical protein